MNKETAQELLDKIAGISTEINIIADEIGLIIEEVILDEEDRNKAQNLVLIIQRMEDTIRKTLLSAPSLDPEFKEALKNY